MSFTPSQVKPVQAQAFKYADLAFCTRRMLRALDGYWGAWEKDGGWMSLWWDTFERYRRGVEAILNAERPAESGGQARATRGFTADDLKRDTLRPEGTSE